MEFSDSVNRRFSQPQTFSMTSKTFRTGAEELKVEFGRYIRGKDAIIEQITESLLVSLGLTSYTQNAYREIIRKLNEAIGIGMTPTNE